MVTKKEFINRLAEKKGATKTETKEWVEAFLETLTDFFREGIGIAFRNFGAFKVAVQKGRSGKSISGGTYKTEDTKVVKFKASEVLKDQLH